MAMAVAFLTRAVAFARPAVPVTPVDVRPAVSIKGRALDQDWPKYCADAAMTGRAHHETAISTASIATMHPAWKVSLSGVIASSPTIVSGRVYVGDWSGTEWELDASNGTILAFTDLGTTLADRCLEAPLKGITSAPAFDGGTLYLAGGDDSFYALNSETLETVWNTKLGDNSATGGYYGWSSPSPIGGRVYQGIASNCDDPFVDGRVVAMDAVSGAIVSLADLSETSDPTHFGSGVWSSPAIDLDSRSVFVTTASAYHYGDGLAYSIVRLSLDELAIEDFWKIPIADYTVYPDADWGSSPTLFHDVNGRLLVGASQKDGHYYVFDRADLTKGPVWITPIAIGGGCPTCGDGSISTASFDGARLYVGGGKIKILRGTSPGSVSALDPATGRPIWTYSQLDGPVLAPTSVANGVVFATAGKTCIALDASKGHLLWKTDAAARLYGGVAISDGRIFFGDTAGNLYAFEVPAPQN